MKVTFEIEVDDALVHQLDYYENFGKLGSESAGCKKCVFNSMCTAFTDQVFESLDGYRTDCKFPCWDSKRDRIAGTNRKVIVVKPNSK